MVAWPTNLDLHSDTSNCLFEPNTPAPPAMVSAANASAEPANSCCTTTITNIKNSGEFLEHHTYFPDRVRRKTHLAERSRGPLTFTFRVWAANSKEEWRNRASIMASPEFRQPYSSPSSRYYQALFETESTKSWLTAGRGVRYVQKSEKIRLFLFFIKMVTVLPASGRLEGHTRAFSGSAEPSLDPSTVPTGRKRQDRCIIPAKMSSKATRWKKPTECKSVARIWQPFRRRVLRLEDQNSSCYADQSNCCRV
jgi:hypothetical protein